MWREAAEHRSREAQGEAARPKCMCPEGEHWDRGPRGSIGTGASHASNAVLLPTVSHYKASTGEAK